MSSTLINIMPTKGSERDEQKALLSLIQKVEGEEWASNKNGWDINSGVSRFAMQYLLIV